MKRLKFYNGKLQQEETKQRGRTKMYKLNRKNTIQELTTEETKILLKEISCKAYEVQNEMIADFKSEGLYYCIE